ncbi:MAG: AAA family ATPase [Ferruginibacter sp.]|nr:AAA family ATPase [Cytophagales bacterium]
MNLLPGYHILEKIITYAGTATYRAERWKDRRKVVLKILLNPTPGAAEVDRFRHGYEAISHLAIRGVPHCYGFENNHDRLLLVIEDFGGVSLKKYRAENPLDLLACVGVAVGLADVLEGLHQHRIIHQDVNPYHLLVNPQTLEVGLTDFTVASGPGKADRSGVEALPAGSLAYASPEQTGRINRTVDHRSDLYSLGVTLYELLTGRLPFDAENALELVHGHIAKKPLPPCALVPAIPRPLSEIILKLMAKNAEDRYQSAAGLKADLRACERQLGETGTVAPFKLAQNDFSGRLNLSRKLYGREQESGTLAAAVGRAAAGGREMLLVEGYSGVGKSALVHQAFPHVIANGGVFIEGKINQFQRNVPYHGFIQAFEEWVRLVLLESPGNLARWRERILKAVGTNGKVLTGVVPNLEWVLGKLLDVPDLEPAETQNRFHYVFRNFIKAVSQVARPLVVFLDDLQWADSASLNLLKVMMTDQEAKHLLFVGAYRNNEVVTSHPFATVVGEIEREKAGVGRIGLDPLALSSVNELITEALGCPAAYAQPLAALVYHKSRGNAFFVNEFLKALFEENLLTFSFHQARWTWDAEQIEQRNITGNVVEFMAGKIQKLPKATQETLKLAACIGNRFDPNHLAIACGRPRPELHQDLQPSLAEGLVVPVGEHYQFAHDRIQQAVYSLIAEPDRQRVHLQIGKLLWQEIGEEKDDSLFEIVNQINIGLELVREPSERVQWANLNLLAGRKAKHSAAYRPAFDYLQTGIDLLPAGAWRTHYPLALALYTEAAGAAFLSNHPAQMENWVETVLQNAATVLDRVKVYEIRIRSCIAHHQLLEAVNTARRVLELLNVRFPEKPTRWHTLLTLLQTKLVLRGKPVEHLLTLPPMRDPAHEAVVAIVASVGSALYLTRPDLYPLLVCKAFRLMVTSGNTFYSGFLCSGYGLILSGGLGDLDAGFRLAQVSLKLLDAFPTEHLRCKTIFMVNTYQAIWKIPLRNTLDPLKEAHQRGLDTGDVEFAAYSAVSYCYLAFYAGNNLLELGREMKTYHASIAQVGHETALRMNEIYQQTVCNLTSPVADPTLLTGEAHDEGKLLPFYRETKAEIATLFTYSCKLLLSYVYGHFPQARKAAGEAEKLLKVSNAIAVPLFYFYGSLAQLAGWEQASAAERSRRLGKVRRNQRKLGKLARHAPVNFLHKVYLVEAELLRVTARPEAAAALYEKAIALARENHYPHEEALAYEVAGRFYLGRQQTGLGEFHLQKAHRAYLQWGALAKVKDLERRYPPFFEVAFFAAPPPDEGTALKVETPAPGFPPESSSAVLDLTSLMKAATAISSETELNRLLEKLIEIAIENAGAQQGFLLLEKGGELFIEAESSVAANHPVTVLRSVPVKGNPLVSEAILQYVRLTKESLLLNDVKRDPRFSADPFLRQKNVRSVLCLPILHHGNVLGLFYLENNLTTDAFTEDRMELLKLLSGHMAVSIENALNEGKRTATFVEREMLLRQINQQQHVTSKAILRTQEHERKRIAEELHDGLGYMLSTLKLNLTAMQETEDKAAHGVFVRNSQLVLEESFRELRSIANNLMPDILFQYGLVPAVEDLCRKINDTGKLRVGFKHFHVAKRFKKDFEIEVFRVLQEVINNVIKHAEAKNLEIQLLNQGAILVITAEDDGKGFNYARKIKSRNKGKGLVHIRSRVDFLRGDFQVESSINRGTTVILKLPLTGESAKPLTYDQVTHR